MEGESNNHITDSPWPQRKIVRYSDERAIMVCDAREKAQTWCVLKRALPFGEGQPGRVLQLAFTKPFSLQVGVRESSSFGWRLSDLSAEPTAAFEILQSLSRTVELFEPDSKHVRRWSAGLRHAYPA